MDNSEWGVSKRHDWAHKHHADTYEAKMGWYARQVDTEVYGKYLEGESGCILDLPCGTGRFLRLIETDYERFYPIGSDYSPNMIAVAKRTTRAPLIRCDGFHLPFQDQCFDVVLCSRLVFHYYAPQDLLREFHRILRLDGVLAFDTLNTFSLRHILALPFNMIRSKHGKQLWFAGFDQVETIITTCEFHVEQRISRYILPTRSYRFLAGFMVRLLATVEPILPESRRVLTYWKVRKVQ